VSFDNDSNEELCVFSGNDLLITHYDVSDLDWQEVAERSALDERRCLVITQVAVLEDLVDEFIFYLADPNDPDAYQLELDKLTVDPRLDRLEALLAGAGMHDANVVAILAALRQVVRRRNDLAHGTIHSRPVQPVQPGSWLDGIGLEWVITSRRSRTCERITMARLRQDLEGAIDCGAVRGAAQLLRYPRLIRPLGCRGAATGWTPQGRLRG
jgi:hypothetical protein